MASRLVRWCGIFVFAALFTVGSAHALAPSAGQVPRQIKAYGVGGHVKLLLNGSKINGQITAIHQDSVEIVPKGGTVAQTVPYASIHAVHDRSSLGSRLKMGPCVGPVTLAIAAPFVTAAYLSGH